MRTLFDIQTLMTFLGLTFLVLGLCMLSYSHYRKTYPGFASWTLGAILQALEFSFIGFRETLPDFIAIVLVNGIGLSAVFFTYRGFKIFAEENIKTSYHVVIILVYTFAIFPFYTYVSPNIEARVIFASFSTGIYFFLCTLIFFRIIRQMVQDKNKLLMISLILLTTLYLLRGLAHLVQITHINDLMTAGLFFEIILLITGMLSISLIIGLMQLNSQKLEIEFLREQEQLKESRKKFQSLSNAAFEGIVITKDNIILEVNNTLCQMFGYLSDDLIGTKITRLFLPEDRQRIEDRINSDDQGIYQINAVKKDDTVFPLEIQARIFLYRDEKGSVAAFRDITDHMQMVGKLKKLGAAVKQSPLSTLITDLKGTIEYVNPKLCETTGYAPQELLGKNSNIFNSGKTSDQIYRDLWETIKNGKQWQGELYNKKKNGGLYWENVRITPILNDQKKVIHFLGIKEDITGHKQRDLKFKNIVEFSNDWIWEINRDSVYTYSSPMVEKILGYKPEDIIGRKPFDLMPQKNAEQTADRFQKIMAGGEHIIYFEHESIHKCGRRVILEISGVPIFDENGNLTHYRGIGRDITERKKMEEKQEEINKILEKKVKERTLELENVNTALKVLLKKREEDKSDLEEKIIQNYESTILPFFEKIRAASLDREHANLFHIIELNLKELVSPFSKKLSGQLNNLTPSEIQIASLIKQGKSNKEISDVLNIAIRTVTNHRNNIRKKLGLINKKVNLRTFLSSL